MFMIVGSALLTQMMTAPGNLEGPSTHPDDYRPVQGLSMDVSSQANGLTPTNRVRLEERIQLLQINSRLFDLYRSTAGQPPALGTVPGPFPGPVPPEGQLPGPVPGPPGPIPGPGPGQWPVPGQLAPMPQVQGPARLVHLEGDHIRVARPADRPLVQADPNGLLTGDQQIIQAYHAARNTHQMTEGALGRPVRFGTPDGRLTVSLDDPRAEFMGPAHLPQDGSIIFPRNNVGSGGDPDVVAHETGHAVLTSQRPQYRYEGHGGTGAVHEAYADVTQLTLALRDPDVRRDVLANRDGSNLASVVGEGAHLMRQNPQIDGPRNPRLGIRDLSQPAPAGDQSHDASQRYSRAIYRSTLEVQAQLRREQPDLTEDQALERANQIVGGNALRAVDFLPVGPSATLEDLARATLRAGDRDQDGRYRALMERNFRENGVQVGGPSDRLREAGYQVMGQNPALRMPAELREGAQFGPSVGAERPPGSGPGTVAEDYLRNNREALGLPEGVSYRAHQLIRNDRGETFVHYSDGQSLADPNNQNYLLLAFDREGRPIHLQDSVPPPPAPPATHFAPFPTPFPQPPFPQPGPDGPGKAPFPEPPQAPEAPRLPALGIVA